ncbi:integrin alpha-M-like isoform X1 [Corythoichthys intestinalis]|uniref:integrin alpha-M-like isoform X1 n=1 Tax=Corythoichthys intestinalis TaxID=161448 RepID=UPI0025A527AB|nr:integrin alpha-M-like isoform X1 [Corythoichthys intestinalis]
MDFLIFITLLMSVLEAAFAFNIDPVAWKTLTNSAEGFGYQIAQRQSDLLVSAPLAQTSSNRRGQIFSCSVHTSTCNALEISVPYFAVNMSFGLTMTANPSTDDITACGPTIPKDCESITMFNGVCLEIPPSNVPRSRLPAFLDECRSTADIAFLLDGSGSVDNEQFKIMKNFVIGLIDSFMGKDSKFAIIQFSNEPRVHSDFSTFNFATWRNDIQGIKQLKRTTNTASAILSVANRVFLKTRGSRLNVKKILIVITDGKSSDSTKLPYAIKAAETKNIVRFAIGVGSAFDSSDAKTELETIASLPLEKHVFHVRNFRALDAIKKTLEDSIFAIEGSQTSGEKLKMEMAQHGFSAAYMPDVINRALIHTPTYVSQILLTFLWSFQGIQIASVGANGWRGGFHTYTDKEQSSYLPTDIDPDSYLGYSITIAQTHSETLTVVGAPRYQHRGIVMVILQNTAIQTIDPFVWQYQIGEYFGAVVCAMDVNQDAITDVVLISAPMFVEDDREGRVYVCSMNRSRVECRFETPLILRGVPSTRGRFGSSLAILPDLNSDGLNDLAVGAPLEDDGQGSVYIFHGEQKGISATFSQRIAGSESDSGLRFFGMSIGQSSADLSGDNLSDLAVGSKGTVILLRSKPIVMVDSTLSYNPKQVLTENVTCENPTLFNAEICFLMSNISSLERARARVNYTLTLDATRKVPSNRAYFNEKKRETSRTMILDLQGPKCFQVKFYIEPCPEDSYNPLDNELQFTFEGLPAANNLSPSLAQQAQMTPYPLYFEIDCGEDNTCEDNLNIDFNFSSSLEVKVGIDELLNVIISVENQGENSYNTLVVLTYPVGFSYRKFTALQSSIKGRIECNSLDSEGGQARGRTECTIDKPIFRSNAKATFVVTYSIDTNSELDNRMFVTANATSGNAQHSALSQPYKFKDIGVKYSIFVTMESSLSYIYFTYGKNDVQKSIQQSVLVSNTIRALNLTFVIRVPVKLGEMDIWQNLNSLQIPDCQFSNDESANITNFVELVQRNKIVDCSVATCRVFHCNRFMETLENKQYEISGNMSSAWIQQVGLNKAKLMFISTASLEYDLNQYIFFSTSSNSNPPMHKIETEVEVYPQPDITKAIVGGSIGGLAIVAILSIVLYKAGFFNSKYKYVINEADGGVAVNDEATLTAIITFKKLF